MRITYTDFLGITDSIREKLYEYHFPAVERDIIMNALGLYGARIPGKLEPSTSGVVAVGPLTLAVGSGGGGSVRAGGVGTHQCSCYSGPHRCLLQSDHLGDHRF